MTNRFRYLPSKELNHLHKLKLKPDGVTIAEGYSTTFTVTEEEVSAHPLIFLIITLYSPVSVIVIAEAVASLISTPFFLHWYDNPASEFAVNFTESLCTKSCVVPEVVINAVGFGFYSNRYGSFAGTRTACYSYSISGCDSRSQL